MQKLSTGHDETENLIVFFIFILVYAKPRRKKEEGIEEELELFIADWTDPNASHHSLIGCARWYYRSREKHPHSPLLSNNRTFSSKMARARDLPSRRFRLQKTTNWKKLQLRRSTAVS